MSKENNLENKYKIKNSINTNAILILEDGEEFRGFGIGAYGISSGEICFNTSITGYQEILTDPSYSGQIINFTFPHIGNVGTNNEDFEAEKTWVKGAIFSAEVSHSSNYRALENLDEWLKRNNITAIYGIDTRKLTLKIRKFGPKKATIAFNKNNNHDLTESFRYYKKITKFRKFRSYSEKLLAKNLINGLVINYGILKDMKSKKIKNIILSQLITG